VGRMPSNDQCCRRRGSDGEINDSKVGPRDGRCLHERRLRWRLRHAARAARGVRIVHRALLMARTAASHLLARNAVVAETACPYRATETGQQDDGEHDPAPRAHVSDFHVGMRHCQTPASLLPGPSSVARAPDGICAASPMSRFSKPEGGRHGSTPLHDPLASWNEGAAKQSDRRLRADDDRPHEQELRPA
jgi:hypothetical protein